MKSTKSVPVAALIIFLSAFFGTSSAGALETVSYFCKDCVSMETARQQALEYAAPVDCGSSTPILDPGSGENCVVSDRLVVLGNHLNNQVYAFLVERQASFPWTASASGISMTSVEIQAYQGVLELRRVWEAFVARGIERPAFRARSMASRDAADCPENTALDAFFDNQYQSLILDQIEVSVSAELERFANEMPLIRRLASQVFLGLSRGGMTVGLRTPDLDDIQTEFTFNFDESEVSTQFGVPDRLVYEVVEVTGTVPTQNLGNIAVTSIELRRELSRVAGEKLDRFLSGETDITNDCVLEKLATLDDSPSGEFQVGGIPLNNDGSVGTGGNGSGGPGGGSPSNMCVYDFFVNGRYQYSFRAPCDAFETNDEIEP